MLTKEQLWELRQEVPIGSLFTKDYRNSFGIEPRAVQDFFDGYLDFLEEEMEYQIPDFNDADFWELLDLYDTPEYLLDWYYCFDEEPLPIPGDDEYETIYQE